MIKLTCLATFLLSAALFSNHDGNGWNWTENQCSLFSYFVHGSEVYDISLVRPASDSNRKPIHVHISKDGKDLFKWQTHDEGTFIISGSTLVYSNHRRHASGCQIFAVDLETATILWTTNLKGLGPIEHSKYHNRINLIASEGVVTIYGNESSGQYIETLDLASGTTLSNTVGPKEGDKF